MIELYNEEAHEIYNRLFPYYAQSCTVTRYRQRARTPGGSQNTGGTGGHATIFLHGACRDDSQVVPQLRICGEQENLEDADSGLGVSVNQVFLNVVWNAIPGRGNFFHGGLEPEEELTWNRYERAIDEFASKSWFRGIELRARETEICRCKTLGRTNCFDDAAHERHLEEPQLQSKLEVLDLSEAQKSRCLVEESIGTDFGLTFARTVLCARVPLNRSALQAMVDELNERNLEAHHRFTDEGVGYVWDPITNNCSHLVANAFAATGMIPAKDVRRPGWASRLITAATHLKIWGGDLSLPVHNFAHVAEASWMRPIESVFELYQNPYSRRAFELHGWIPTAPGAVIEVIRIRPGSGVETGNQLFQEGEPGVDVLKTDVLTRFTNYVPSVVVQTNPLKLRTALRPNASYREYYSDLCKGLVHFRRRLGTARSEMMASATPREAYRQLRRMVSWPRRRSLDPVEFETFWSRYRRYVDDTLAEIENDLDRYQAFTGENCRSRTEANEGDPLQPNW
jgi:hypothetical protein